MARTFFTVEEIRRVIDLLELYKLNVLHLHLTDDQAWPLALGRRPPARSPAPLLPRRRPPRPGWLRRGPLRHDVPEIDTPGHTSALLRLRPDLRSGRNQVEYEFLPGHRRRAVWLDPELPATFELMEQVLAGVAGFSPARTCTSARTSPAGCRTRRTRRTSGGCAAWSAARQATAGLAGVGAGRPSPDDVIQLWLTGIDLPASALPQVRAQARRRWPCHPATPRRWRRHGCR